MILKIITISVISIILFSCNTAPTESTIEESEIEKYDEHEHNEEKEVIVLNKGEKWEVDKDMMTHIQNMEKDFLAFTETKQKDYKSLAKKLQTNLDLLTSNCTMEGQAHDELHKWLLPYIDLVDELSEVKNEKEGAGAVKKIQESFNTFNTYFQ